MLFLLSFPFVPAIELLNRQSLRRNYGSALKPGFCGGSTCGNCKRPFLSDHLPRPGYFIFLVQQLQEAAFIAHLKLLYRAYQVRYSPRGQGRSVRGTLRSNPGEATLAGQRPWRFPSAFRKADSRPEGHEPRIGYALSSTKRDMARYRQTPICPYNHLCVQRFEQAPPEALTAAGLSI